MLDPSQGFFLSSPTVGLRSGRGRLGFPFFPLGYEESVWDENAFNGLLSFLTISTRMAVKGFPPPFLSGNLRGIGLPFFFSFEFAPRCKRTTVRTILFPLTYGYNKIGSSSGCYSPFLFLFKTMVRNCTRIDISLLSHLRGNQLGLPCLFSPLSHTARKIRVHLPPSFAPRKINGDFSPFFSSFLFSNSQHTGADANGVTPFPLGPLSQVKSFVNPFDCRRRRFPSFLKVRKYRDAIRSFWKVSLPFSR